MERDCQTLINKLPEIVTPAHLRADVFERINKEARIRSRARFTLFATTSLASLTSLFFLTVSVVKSLIASGAYSYASLLFSDVGAVTTFWKEFTLSFVESLPVLGIAAVLSMGIVFLWTSAKALKDIRPASLIIN